MADGGRAGGRWPVVCNINITGYVTKIWLWRQILAAGDITVSVLNKLLYHLHQTNRTEPTGSDRLRERHRSSAITANRECQRSQMMPP